MSARLLRQKSLSLHSTLAEDSSPPCPSNDKNFVEVIPLKLDMVASLAAIQQDGFGSKTCCCLFPMTENESNIRNFYSKHPERLSVCGIAKNKGGEVVGYI